MQQKVKTKLPNNQLFDLTVKNESLSNRIEELEKEVTHLQKQKGGFVKNNNEYREKLKACEDNSMHHNHLFLKRGFAIEVLNNEILELNAQLKSKDIRIKSLGQQIDALKLLVKYAEGNHDKQLNLNKAITEELKSIKSKWWYKLFNW